MATRAKSYEVKIQHLDYDGPHETVTVRVVAENALAAESASLRKVPRAWKGRWVWAGTRVAPEPPLSTPEQLAVADTADRLRAELAPLEALRDTLPDPRARIEARRAGEALQEAVARLDAAHNALPGPAGPEADTDADTGEES